MALKVGDTVPQFSGLDAFGKTFESSTYFGKKWLVVYFYPKDDTPGCTTQACSFRDAYQDFTDLGVAVVGISSDSVPSHLKFQSKFNLPFILLADTKKEIRKLFGVPNDFMGLLDGRATYVIGLDQKIHYIFDSIGGKWHMENALAFLKSVI